MQEETIMFYLRWTKDDIVDLEKGTSIFTIFIEVSLKGKVIREVGLDEKGIVVHKCPSDEHKYGKYGIFDLVPVDTESLRNDITKDQFEEFWNK